MSGIRPGLTVAAVLLLTMGVITATGRDDRRSEPPGEVDQARIASSGGQRTTGAAPDRGPSRHTSAPLRPPARICGSASLDGPATQPPGTIRVTPGHDLQAVVERSPRGATFWLTPGTHHLGDDEYDQVGPRRDQSFIGAPGAVVDGRRLNRYAFGGHASGVTIEHLTIQHFVAPRDEGVVNHEAANGWRIRHNTIRLNGGAGVFLGDGTVAAHNCLARNGQYGFSAVEPDGVRRVVLRHNEVVGNNTDDWEERAPGCGCTGGGKFWDTRGALVLDNWIHDNDGAGIWADTNNTGFVIEGNYIEDNYSQGVIYETSYNARIVGNTFLRNGLGEGPGCDCFPVAALYLSESGSDRRAGERFGRVFVVARNRFVDNWSGIIAWENADRFSGSPANTSTGYTTLVNPHVATEQACSDPDLVARRPYVDDCRWKTQHLRIRDNLFSFEPSTTGENCRPSDGCGHMGLFSNIGTVPEWSPYLGDRVEDAITFGQDNVWSGNRYRGPWRFIVHDLGNVVGWRTWRAAPYGQDRGSTPPA